MKSNAIYRPRLAPGERLHRMLMQFATLAEDDLRRISKTPAHSVHALRTRMKKLRSILRLAHGQIALTAEEAISQTARDAKDAFDAVRNQDVMTRLLSKWSPKDAIKMTRPKMPATLLEQTRLLLGKLQCLIAVLPMDALCWKKICRAHDKSYRAARRWMKRADSDDPDDLHHWRRRVKDLYYQSLALRHLGGMGHRIRQSHRLGSRLGKYHDLELLRHCAAAKLSPADIKLVQQTQAALHKKIYAVGAKLFRKNSDDFRHSLMRRCPAHA